MDVLDTATTVRCDFLGCRVRLSLGGRYGLGIMDGMRWLVREWVGCGGGVGVWKPGR